MEKLRFVNSWIEDCQVMEKHIRRQGRTGVILEILEALNGHPKTGHVWSLQNRPYRNSAQDGVLYSFAEE